MYAVIESRGRFSIVEFPTTQEHTQMWAPFRTLEGAHNCRDRLIRRQAEKPQKRHYPFRFLLAVIAAAWVGYGFGMLLGWVS